MTLSSTATRTRVAGNGVTTAFSYAFRIDSQSAAQLVYTDASGVDTVLSSGLWSITGTGSDSGGTFTYPLSGSPIASGTYLTLSRVTALTQGLALPAQGTVSPPTVEAALDKLTEIAQENADTYGRTLRGPVSDPSGLTYQLPSATARAGKLLAFDSNGNATVAASTAGVIAIADLPTNVRQVPIPFTYEGKPLAGQPRIVVLAQPYVIPANLAGTVAWFSTAATGSSAFVLRVRQSGTIATHGTLTINSGGTVALPVASARTLAAGDALLFDPPSPADATLADGGWTILVNRS